jgi:hypothetical protein
MRDDPTTAYEQYIAHFLLAWNFDRADANQHHSVADYK